jgi:hypothetical protein
MRSTLHYCLVLASAVAIAAAGCAAKGQQPPDFATAPVIVASSPGAASAKDVETQQLTANLRAAIANHDMRMYGQFRKRLTEIIGQDAIRSAHETYRQALANLVAARARHDGKAQASFYAQLRALCSSTNMTSALEFCEKDLAALGM